MSLVMPPTIAEIRRDSCPGCECGANPLDPCAACPNGKWGQWMHCEPDLPPPADQAAGFPQKPSASTPGAGTCLKRLLARVSILAANRCQCDAHAAQMDALGPDWCERNLDLIVGWLKEEAVRRHMPFLPSVARLLVRKAIRDSRRLRGV